MGRWSDAAQSLGLVLEREGVWGGALERARVRVEPGGRVLVLARHPEVAVRGLRIRPLGLYHALFGQGLSDGSSLGLHFHIDAPLRRRVGRLLQSQDVRRALWDLAPFKRALQVDEGEVRLLAGPLTRDPRCDPQALIVAVAWLAQVLSEGFAVGWRAVARERGLTLSFTDGDALAPVLRGVIDGVTLQVRVTERFSSDTRLVTVIRGELDHPMPAGLHVVREGTGRGGSPWRVTLHDPVLRSLVDVYASDPDETRALLSHEGLHGPLLEVVHGHPGSQVTHEAVVLVYGGVDGASMGERIDGVVRLVKVLREAARALQRPDTLEVG
ncbi:MAG: hypothetical protein H6739_42035 [Alphaproteobacteria bacterium]|nr:hypothetical protein [Alphaproteobacteria bacterium]